MPSVLDDIASIDQLPVTVTASLKRPASMLVDSVTSLVFPPGVNVRRLFLIKFTKNNITEYYAIDTNDTEEKQCIGKGSSGVVFISQKKIIYNATTDELKLAICDTVIKRVLKPEADLKLETTFQKANRVKVVGVVTQGVYSYAIMENCGVILNDFIKPDLLHYVRLQIALSICTELLLLRDQGVVHRDLKPRNICIRPMGTGFQTNIIDFGFASTTQQSIQSGKKKEIKGTYNYMDPALLTKFGPFMHRSKRPHTFASDVYGFAAILGFIFGATNINQHKESAFKAAESKRLCRPSNPGMFRTTADYCLDGLFDYDQTICPKVKVNIRKLIESMQNKNPRKRPKLEKIFVTLQTALAIPQALHASEYYIERLIYEKAKASADWYIDRLQLSPAVEGTFAINLYTALAEFRQKTAQISTDIDALKAQQKQCKQVTEAIALLFAIQNYLNTSNSQLQKDMQPLPTTNLIAYFSALFNKIKDYEVDDIPKTSKISLLKDIGSIYTDTPLLPDNKEAFMETAGAFFTK